MTQGRSGPCRTRADRRIDASTNSVTAAAPVPKPLSWVAAGGGFAWTANETKGTVYKVDQTGEIVATYRTGDGARSVSFANGTLWVANSDAGTLSAIDAASGAVRTYRFGHPVGDAVAVRSIRPAVHRRRPDGRGSHRGSAGEGREARHPHLHARSN